MVVIKAFHLGIFNDNTRIRAVYPALQAIYALGLIDDWFKCPPVACLIFFCCARFVYQTAYWNLFPAFILAHPIFVSS